jgi:methyl coenzyme M reductase alpha subunit
MSTPVLLTKYKEKVVPTLKEKLGYANPHQVPRLEKIVVTSCMGKSPDRKVAVDDAVARPALYDLIASFQQQRIERQAKAVKFIGEAAHAGLIAQINMQYPARIGRDANLSGCGLRFGQIAACHDDQPTPIRQGLGSPQTHARRSASDDRRWLNSSLD